MIYNNLIYLLVVILIFSLSGVPDAPQIPWRLALLIFLAKGLFYQQIIHYLHGKKRIIKAAQYFSAEQKISILAIGSIAIDVYLLDCQYYLAKIPLAEKIPVLISLCGLLLFFFYLSLMWLEAARSYYAVFGKQYAKGPFLLHNIKTNLPIVLPWLLLSLLSDILQFASPPEVKKFLASPWGEPAILFAFFIVLAVWFPVIITRLWNCKPLPPSETRTHIEKFCRTQTLKYADILTWPLFEGQVLTAGVMGLIPKFRYLLITPAMLKTMSLDEIDSVMAHEIGHVKKYHLQLYLFLFIGFGLLAQLSAYPILYALLNSDIFYLWIDYTGREPAAALALTSSIPMLLLMVLYFRYLFGFFMRNFERQADLHVFKAMTSSKPLIQVLEKIAWMSGNIRDLPSWHHFGIGQRVDHLQKCEHDNSCIKKHDRKVRLALSLYLLAVIGAIIILWKMPADILEGAPREKFAEAVIKQKIETEPSNPLWHKLMGDLQFERKLYGQAVSAYESAMAIVPNDADLLNNLAWLLLTAEDKNILDPSKALSLARDAARLKPTGYILDTLAMAYLKNGFIELAMQTEKKAATIDPSNHEYYQKQLKKFEALKHRPPPE